MTKTELLGVILDIVCQVCEVSMEDLCSMRKSESIVQARCIYVTECLLYGLPAGVIAQKLNRQRVVSVYDCARNHAIYRRQSYSYREMCAQVDRNLSEMYPRC